MPSEHYSGLSIHPSKAEKGLRSLSEGVQNAF